MITEKVSMTDILEWHGIFERHKAELKPNFKNREEVFAYISSKYTVEPYKKWKGYDVYKIVKDDKSKILYDNQDKVFADCEAIIFYFSDTNAKDFCNVEGSSMFWDECFAYRGLDENDLTNFVLVGQYLQIKEKKSE